MKAVELISKLQKLVEARLINEDTDVVITNTELPDFLEDVDRIDVGTDDFDGSQVVILTFRVE